MMTLVHTETFLTYQHLTQVNMMIMILAIYLTMGTTHQVAQHILKTEAL